MPQFIVNLHAVVWIVLTGFLAVSINTLARLLSDDFHYFQLVFFYNALGLLVYMPALFRGHLSLKTKRYPLYWFRAILEFAGFSLLFYAVTLMPLPTHTALSFTSPLFGSILAIMFLREPNSLHRWLAVGMGLVGVLIITEPWQGAFHLNWLLVLLAAFSFACCGICIKKLTSTEPSARVAFYMLALTAIVAFPFALENWRMPSWEHLPYLALLGVLVASVQYTVSQAYSRADVTTIVPFFFLNLVWSSIYAFFLFDEFIKPETLVGGAIIIGGTFYAAYQARRKVENINIRATEQAAAGN